MRTTSLVFIRALSICAVMLSSTAVFSAEVYLTLDGTTLNADLVLAEGESIDDGVFLIVHGTLGHKDMEIIETLQAVLQESGRNSLAINLSLNINDRHGFYPCDHCHTHRSGDAIAELAAWVDWLQGEGATDIVLMGHSRGANQATRYVLSNQTTISNLILLAPPATDGSISGEKLRKLTDTDPDNWLSDTKFLHCDKSDVQVASYLSYRGPEASNNTVALLPNVQIPTLVVSGSDDEVVPELATQMVGVANKLVSHIEIDGADHFFRDLYAYDVVDAIDEFLLEAAPPLIEMAISLQADAREFSSQGKTIVVFISQHSCEFCELLRRRVLYPMIRRGDLDQRIELREVSLDTNFELIDFQGLTTQGLEFAQRYDAYVTPTLLFLDAVGNSLTEPLVGTGNIEFYSFYLQQKIDEATGALASP